MSLTGAEPLRNFEYGQIEGPAREALEEIFGDRLSFNESIRGQHGADLSYHVPQAPDAVAFANSEAEIVAAVKICAEYQIPVIPYGAGSSLEGHTLAVHGGLSLDVTQMDRILSVDPEDFRATVQAGVTREALNHHLRDHGLFFSVDPGANATLGGMSATRASGTSAVRYGTMRENVMRLRVVLASGEAMDVGSRAKKSSAGYDLARLMVGSEGTLGVITEVTVNLVPVPEKISSAIVSFEALPDAVDAAMSILQAAIPVARIELLDEVQIRASNAYSKLELEEKPTLFLEFHGSEAGVEEQAEMAGALCAEFRSGKFVWAVKTEDRNRLWKARHNAAYAANAYRPGCRPMVTDVCVPLSNLAECLLHARDLIDGGSFPAVIAGHVGDGNFHAAFLIDPDNPMEIEQAHAMNDKIVDKALACGGTCTGEHGIGLGKRKSLRKEAGDAVHLMRTIKQALDPGNILNPGKIF